MKNLIILSGISGAGRSTAAMAFEELGYNVIENIPKELIAPLLTLIARDEEGLYNKTVLVANILEVEKVLKYTNKHPEIEARFVLLTAEKGELLTRYKLTRHLHPLQINGKTLEEGLTVEKEVEQQVRDQAYLFIDTTGKTVSDLRKIIFTAFRKHRGKNVTSINFVSFGFKHGIPIDADLVFDTRTIPNPYYVPSLADKTGRSRSVVKYLEEQAETSVFKEKLIAYLDYYLLEANREARGYVTIAIGCSGGQHRSVYFAEFLKKHYQKKYRTFVSHRDVVRFRNH